MRFVVLLIALISVCVAACDDGDGAGDGTPSAIEPTPPARATPPEPGETEEHQTDVVEAFIENDPFTKAGLFESVTVTRWRKAFFNYEKLI